MANKERILTSNQQAFLDALFGEAKGDGEKAKKLAGYAESVRVSEITKSLRAEIVSIAMDLMALNAPRAAFGLVDLLSDPNQAGASNKIKVAQEILNRSGAQMQQEQVQLNIPKGGLFIMPAKGSQVTGKEDEDPQEETKDEER